MAYDPNSYQAPARRYNGPAARAPAPAQSYSQPPPPQAYPPQQFDPYAQDGYGNGYDNNGYDNNGYANNGYDQGYDQGGYDAQYQQPPMKNPARQQQQQGGQYSSQTGGYPTPPHQNDPYYGNGGGGGPRPQNRGGGGWGSYGQPQNADRGGYGDRGGGGRGGPPMAKGPGGRPMPLEPDPGLKAPRKPPMPSPVSPRQQSWDNPFPPIGNHKKPSVPEEKKVVDRMGNMHINGGQQQQRPSTRTESKSNSVDPRQGSGRERPMQPESYGRPSVDSQRSGRGYPPQQGRPGGPGGPDPRRGPATPGGFVPPPRKDSFGRPSGGTSGGPSDAYQTPTSPLRNDFSLPPRSNTMPQNMDPGPMGRGATPGAGPFRGAAAQRHEPAASFDAGPSAPYNGPVGRHIPPRPSTATGARPVPQRQYPSQPAQSVQPVQPVQQQSLQPYQESYSNGSGNGYGNANGNTNGYGNTDGYGNNDHDNYDFYQEEEYKNSHAGIKSFSELYDAYYQPPPSVGGRRPDSTASTATEIPNFDATPVQSRSHRRGASIDDHLQPGMDSSPATYRGQPEMNSSPEYSRSQQGMNSSPEEQRQRVNARPVMHQTKSYPDFRAEPQSAVFEMAGDAPPLPHNFSQQGYNGPQGRPSLDQGYGGSQGRPSLDQGYGGYDQGNQQQFPQRSTSGGQRPSGPGPNGPSPLNNSQPPRSASQSAPPNPDALPSHPVPVRPGQMPGSVAQQAMNRPPPVRNYNGVGMTPGPQPVPAGPSPQQTPPVERRPSPSPIQPQQGAQQQRPAQRNASAPGPPPVTNAEIEQLKASVKQNPNNQENLLTLARKEIEASEVLVPALPDARTRAKAREKYVMDAHKRLKKLVSLNNTEAMFFLADCYGRGSLGLETDNKEAFALYQNAAKSGHPAAAYRTAVCCELGQEEGGGTRKDPLKAMQWYKRAATLGDVPAMYKMGMILLKGLLGQPRNPGEAVQWLKRAAERADAENPHALHEIGLLYESPQQGNGSVIRDEAYALSLFRQAADLGYKFSQFRLGTAYEYGLLGLQIDARSSIMWYSRAAVQEEHASELALSGWYLTGSEGVLGQSDTEAYLWARKAAMSGLAKAEYAMGYFTEVGIGTERDIEGAKRWYWRAAAQNYPKARERLEDLKKGGSKPQLKSRERISRSRVGKQNEGECAVM